MVKTRTTLVFTLTYFFCNVTQDIYYHTSYTLLVPLIVRQLCHPNAQWCIYFCLHSKGYSKHTGIIRMGNDCIKRSNDFSRFCNQNCRVNRRLKCVKAVKKALNFRVLTSVRVTRQTKLTRFAVKYLENLKHTFYLFTYVSSSFPHLSPRIYVCLNKV